MGKMLLDQATCPRLLEENAATAKTLEQQARAMDERVSFFRLARGMTASSAATAKPIKTATNAPRRAPAKSARNGNAVRPEDFSQAS